MEQPVNTLEYCIQQPKIFNELIINEGKTFEKKTIFINIIAKEIV